LAHSRGVSEGMSRFLRWGNSSRIGFIILHGIHLPAPKSTRRGNFAATDGTVVTWLAVANVACAGALPAAGVLFCFRTTAAATAAATGEMKLAQNGRFEMGSSSIRFLTPIH